MIQKNILYVYSNDKLVNEIKINDIKKFLIDYTINGADAKQKKQYDPINRTLLLIQTFKKTFNNNDIKKYEYKILLDLVD